MAQPKMADQGNPKAQPNAAKPQCPKVRPDATPGKAKPPVPADQSQVAKIRHLRQAAEHLAAAGFAAHAAKAREEIKRMEAELAESTVPAPAPTKKVKPRETPSRDNKPLNPQPETDRAPDASAALLGEMRKLNKQVQQLNGRIQKLEARAAE
jgi:hypothetical protein